MKIINIAQALNGYKKEDLCDLIKILVNNSYLDLINAIFIKEQGFTGSDILYSIEDEELSDENIENNKISILYYNENVIKQYILYKKTYEKQKENIDFLDISNKYYKYTSKKVIINDDIDDNKKDYVLIDNQLLLSDILSKRDQIKSIIKNFAEIEVSKNNNAFDYSVIKLFIDYYIDNIEPNINEAIVKYKLPDIKYYIINSNFMCFRKILKVFFKENIELNDYIYLINNEVSRDDINVKYDKESVDKLIKDIKIDNINEFPIYYLQKE